MKYSEYRDRVFGCWLGKCVCGSIGAPLEGAKQLFDYSFDPQFWKITLPNDDLELQVLWLNVIEAVGLDFDSDDLAKAFVDNVPYNPGEYATFKRNYRRGIHPPTSGAYNNHYYHEGMGCCIRAEIWACMAAGDPQLAAKVCQLDGRLDHDAESIYSEMFVAAMEAQAFVEQDLERLLDVGMSVIPADSRLHHAIADTRRWCTEIEDWRMVREEILRHYGHPDCTNMFQNICFTVMALLKGDGNLEKATMIALNSGYDSDCTCGIAGALIGICKGAEALKREFGVEDTGYVSAFELHRKSNTIEQLADDVARLSSNVERKWKRRLVLEDVPEYVAAFRLPERCRACSFAVEYQGGNPVLTIGGSANFSLVITNLTDKDLSGELAIQPPMELRIDGAPKDLTVKAGSCVAIPLTAVHLNNSAIDDTQLVAVSFAGCNYSFGFAAAVPWKVYGPYWENFFTVPQENLIGYHYSKTISKGEFPNRFSAIRAYHLNARATLELVGLDEEALAKGTLKIPAPMSLYAMDDLIPLDGNVGYQGPAVFYLTMEFELPHDMKITFSIGRSCPLAFWVDGSEVVRMKDETWLTPENLNLDPMLLSQGRHRVMFKVVRQNRITDLSLIIRNAFRPKELDDAISTELRYIR